MKREAKSDKTILVATTIIAVMAYHASISPSGGIFSMDASKGAVLPDPYQYHVVPGTSILA